MSAEAISAVLHHSRAVGSTKMVLVGIAWHTSDTPELGCFPSQQTLADYANITPRQVRRALQELERLGELEIDKHGGIIGSGNNTTNRYYIRLDCPEECDNSLWHRYTVAKVIHRARERQDIYGRATGHLR